MRTMSVTITSVCSHTDADFFKMSSEIGALSGISSLEAISMHTTRTFPKQSPRRIMMIETRFTQCERLPFLDFPHANESRRFNLHAAALFPEMTNFRDM